MVGCEGVPPPPTPPPRHACRYAEVLLRYGDQDPAAALPLSQSAQPPAAFLADATSAAAAATAFGATPEPGVVGGGGVYATPPRQLEVIRRLHEGGAAWPRDDTAWRQQQQQQQQGQQGQQGRRQQRR